ncbi:hypothetical protein E4U13_000264 [Claviceps humidiphila]|uniref:SsDNA binding protein n=2 Tax=Claviceps TaxID=5110 RepID=A0A9P7Q544_9HYPO|nr:hypothetical protein E4U56_002997 [Claviceps arundinis]KAG6089429.1 hypothetical protein E4U15_002861 [Claviceps sp. LM218 group G6]KAG6118354.1 hypothetical protein E4U13_000264 [Claviceps humidiphila]
MSSFLFRRATAASVGAARSFSTSTPRSIARISIIGNLADTPEVFTTSTGKEMIKYAVASNHGTKDNRQTSWFKVTNFVEGPRRDYMLSLSKGTLVFVEGEASLRNYQDKEGQTRTALNITQRNIEVLKRPQTDGQESQESQEHHHEG